jgi:hypothetical protein
MISRLAKTPSQTTIWMPLADSRNAGGAGGGMPGMPGMAGGGRGRPSGAGGMPGKSRKDPDAYNVPGGSGYIPSVEGGGLPTSGGPNPYPPPVLNPDPQFQSEIKPRLSAAVANTAVPTTAPQREKFAQAPWRSFRSSAVDIEGRQSLSGERIQAAHELSEGQAREQTRISALGLVQRAGVEGEQYNTIVENQSRPHQRAASRSRLMSIPPPIRTSAGS